MNKRKFNIRYTVTGTLDVQVIAENHLEAEELADQSLDSVGMDVVVDSADLLSWSDQGPVPLEKDPNQPDLFEEES